ncbi:cytokinesis protein [Pyrenophora seminiperda CCB06]|uniref:Cytokinesis protein n=1 Tax=Pyrenophora seminiperda CCB06 TaxID=1302712 RepID=A0A3M7MBH8_9PLEO|nr:cytokinesis protein [Pyrenophora seminiperda CCB06]
MPAAEIMFGSPGEGLITKLASYFTADKHPVLEATPAIETETSLATPVINSAATRVNNATTGKGDSTKPISTASSRHLVTRSASDTVVSSQQMHSERLTAVAALNAVHSKRDERQVTNTPQHLLQVTLQSPRCTRRRSMSSSRVELSSPCLETTISFTALPKPHTEQSILETSRPPRPARARYASSVSGPAMETRPSPTRSTALRSCSDPDLAKAFANPKIRDCNVPLKPCIKKKVGIVTTPSSEEFPQAKATAGPRTLRRVKTVDFEGNSSSKSLPLPPDHVTLDRLNRRLKNGTDKTSVNASKTKRTVKKSPSCPNTIGITKSSVADTAVTRTDVHVIAIAPQWDAQEVISEDDMDSATPTMQIIETKSASYEIVWDDVPSEHSVRTGTRRSSSASHALEAATPGATRGLERVNTKLAYWSGTWNTPSERFKPTIVVFPDDDGRAIQHDCAVEIDDELIVPVPPNSEMTSHASSRFSSRPASGPMTRAASNEEMSFSDALKDTRPQFAEHLLPVLEQTLGELDPEMKIGGGQKKKTAIELRKLSNIEEADIKFRGHRDSVTIAHSRLVRSRGTSSGLSAHRDSVSIGKKRIRARKRAMPVSRAIRRRSGEMRNLIEDDDMSEESPLLPPTVNLVKEKTAQTIKDSTPSSSSLLNLSQQSPDARHIRIVE